MNSLLVGLLLAAALGSADAKTGRVVPTALSQYTGMFTKQGRQQNVAQAKVRHRRGFPR